MPTKEFIYIMSPEGELDQTPCKIGVTRWPDQRLARCIEYYEHATEQLDFAALFECDDRDVAESVEKDLKNKTQDESLNGKNGEWRTMTGEEIAPLLKADERCELYTGERPSPSRDNQARFNARIPERLHKAFQAVCEREGRSMSWVVEQYMQRAVEEGSTGL